MTVLRTGIILAGGQSRRMGRPKALLEIGSVPMLTHVVRALVPNCDELLLSVANEEESPPDLAEKLQEAARRGGGEARVVRDAAPDQGPIAGLVAALDAARGKVAFVSGCDSPFLREELVRSLLDRIDDPPPADAVVPRREGRLEPLLAAYRVAPLLDHFRDRLLRGGGPISAGFSELRIREITAAALKALDPDGSSFANINTPGEYERALDRRARRA